jgi:hypothetical protein
VTSTDAGSTDDAITFVITSCGRFDLLEQTLASFLSCNTAPICRHVLVEDSGDRQVNDVLSRFAVPFEVMLNDPPLGQIAAIDRAYRTVTTPYIFHCEDDWRFFRPNFIEDSLAVLRHDPSVTVVVSRRAGQNETVDKMLAQGLPRSTGRIHYRTPLLWDALEWHGYSFNPGLCRLSDYRQLGSFSHWGHEAEASLYFKLRGRGVAYLVEPACETTGSARRLPKQLPTLPLRSRLQFLYGRWRFNRAQQRGSQRDRG